MTQMNRALRPHKRDKKLRGKRRKYRKKKRTGRARFIKNLPDLIYCSSNNLPRVHSADKFHRPVYLLHVSKRANHNTQLDQLIINYSHDLDHHTPQFHNVHKILITTNIDDSSLISQAAMGKEEANQIIQNVPNIKKGLKEMIS